MGGARRGDGIVDDHRSPPHLGSRRSQSWFRFTCSIVLAGVGRRSSGRAHPHSLVSRLISSSSLWLSATQAQLMLPVRAGKLSFSLLCSPLAPSLPSPRGCDEGATFLLAPAAPDPVLLVPLNGEASCSPRERSSSTALRRPRVPRLGLGLWLVLSTRPNPPSWPRTAVSLLLALQKPCCRRASKTGVFLAVIAANEGLQQVVMLRASGWSRVGLGETSSSRSAERSPGLSSVLTL